MYTFIVFHLDGSLEFESDFTTDNLEHLADRIAFWDDIMPSLDETCIALVTEEV